MEIEGTRSPESGVGHTSFERVKQLYSWLRNSDSCWYQVDVDISDPHVRALANGAFETKNFYRAYPLLLRAMSLVSENYQADIIPRAYRLLKDTRLGRAKEDSPVTPTVGAVNDSQMWMLNYYVLEDSNNTQMEEVLKVCMQVGPAPLEGNHAVLRIAVHNIPTNSTLLPRTIFYDPILETYYILVLNPPQPVTDSDWIKTATARIFSRALGFPVCEGNVIRRGCVGNNMYTPLYVKAQAPINLGKLADSKVVTLPFCEVRHLSVSDMLHSCYSRDDLMDAGRAGPTLYGEGCAFYELTPLPESKVTFNRIGFTFEALDNELYTHLIKLGAVLEAPVSQGKSLRKVLGVAYVRVTDLTARAAQLRLEGRVPDFRNKFYRERYKHCKTQSEPALGETFWVPIKYLSITALEGGHLLLQVQQHCKAQLPPSHYFTTWYDSDIIR